MTMFVSQVQDGDEWISLMITAFKNNKWTEGSGGSREIYQER